MTFKPPVLTQIEEYMKDKNPDDYILYFGNKDISIIFQFQPVNGTIMESVYNHYLEKDQIIIMKKSDLTIPYKPILH